MSSTSADGTTEDTHATPADNGGVEEQPEQSERQKSEQSRTERVFTQAELDAIVQRRLGEQKERLAKQYEKSLQDALRANEAERETTIQQRVEVKLNEYALNAAKQTLAEQYGLSEAQLSRLTGNTPDELRADAETLFGMLKKPAPHLPTGSRQHQAVSTDPLEAAVIAGLQAIK